MSSCTRKFLLSAALASAACEPGGAGGPGTGSSDTGTTDTPSSGDLPAPTTSFGTTGTSGDDTTSFTGTYTASATLAIDPPPFCGDGALDPGEECDLGAENADDGSCTLICANARCGDGLIWTGAEACDLGDANSPSYGGCAPDCQLSSRCGDGTLDAGYEQCDDGALNGTGSSDGSSAPCTKMCRWLGRTVFISSQTYDGAFSGLPWADSECYHLAFWAGLDNPKSYRAWLSDGVYAPNSRFEYKDAGVPYILLNGQVFAGDYDELIKDGPRRGLTITEEGDLLVGVSAWTNTASYGGLLSPTEHCAGWTTANPDFSARVGLNAVEVEDGPAWETWKDWGQWTTFADQNCQESAHLYCFEDGPIDGP